MQYHVLPARSIDVLDLTKFPGAESTDPFAAVGERLAGMNASIRAILGVDHPVLHKVRAFANRAVIAANVTLSAPGCELLL